MSCLQRLKDGLKKGVEKPMHSIWDRENKNNKIKISKIIKKNGNSRGIFSLNFFYKFQLMKKWKSSKKICPYYFRIFFNVISIFRKICETFN